MRRLSIALGAYILLGILAWTTLAEGRIRLISMAILGLFAIRTWLYRNRVMEREQDRDKG